MLPVTAQTITTIAALLLAPGAPQGTVDPEPPPQPRVVLPDESRYSASPLDGLGSASITPSVVVAGEPVTMTAIYTAAAQGISPGGGLVAHVSEFWHWTSPQISEPRAPGFVRVWCSDPAVRLEVNVGGSAKGAIVVLVHDRALRGGQTITIVYGDTSGGKFPTARGRTDRYAERGERLFIKVDGDGDGWFTPITPQPTIQVQSRAAERLVAFGPSRAYIGESFEASVAALDPAGNLVESFVGKVRLATNAEVLSLPAVLRFEADDRGAKRFRVTPLASGLTAIEAADPDERLAAAISNPVVVVEPRPERYRLYWADLHGHSNLSDGTGTPDDYYRYARDVARLDVSALTDHDHWGYLPLDENPPGFQNILDATDRYHESGRFVTYYGYEWTNWTWGHKHVLFTVRSDADVFSWQTERSDRPDKLWKLLDGRDCLTIAHHPGGGAMPTDWRYHHAHLQPLVEIVSVHGISERTGQPGGIYAPEPSGMVQAALGRGHRLGIVGSGDTHDGHPGIGTPSMPPPGLAGIYATQLSREAIFEALRARRVYASSGARIVLRFHIGPTPMGGVVKLPSADTVRRLQVTVLGEAAVAGITVVKNNSDVHHVTGASLVAALDWTDPAPARTGDYYYIRVTQADGRLAWSSPIWLDVSDD